MSHPLSCCWTFAYGASSTGNVSLAVAHLTRALPCSAEGCLLRKVFLHHCKERGFLPHPPEFFTCAFLISLSTLSCCLLSLSRRKLPEGKIPNLHPCIITTIFADTS